MELNEYQNEALKTAIYPNKGSNYIYPALGVANEMGELLGKIKKLERGDYGDILESEDAFHKFQDMICGELGDSIWYISVLASEFGLSLEDVCNYNLSKLAKRKEENKLMGDGDNR